MESGTSHDGMDEFATLLAALRQFRRKRKAKLATDRLARRKLSPAQRQVVLQSTAGRCHICGGIIGKENWHADHVLSHSGGGLHALDNYLPAHAICNNYRWDYTADEFQQILKLGVWLRTQIERRTTVGREAAKRYLAHEAVRQKRRKQR
jgi:5-methylcytosine-specific restriction endonuclease McrA